MTSEAAALHTVDLAVGYATWEATRLLIEHLNLRADAGQLACLAAPNGAGKTTLLRALAGITRPLAGTVRCRNADVHEMSTRQLAQCVGVVLTDRVDNHDLTVRQVVSLGRYAHTGWSGRLTKADHAIVDECLTMVDASPMEHRILVSLSDGERQRVMLARALAQQPSVLILDEPTAHLDVTRRVELFRLLRRIAADWNLAVVLSTHEIELAVRFADTLHLITRECRILSGSPEDLGLQGSIASVFDSKDVRFDPRRGAFLDSRPPRARVSVVGGALALDWTCRLVERHGCELVDGDDEPDCSIRIIPRGGDVCWHLDDGPEEFATLSALGSALAQRISGS